MGQRGPAPLPTAVKRLHGERPVNLDEPIPAHRAVQPPDWLNPEALQVWHQLADDLVAKGVLTPWDADTFAILCDAVAQYRQASKFVAAAGVLIKGRRDNAIKNPAMQLARDTAATVRAYAREFGLTPSARSGIAIDGEADSDGPGRLLT